MNTVACLIVAAMAAYIARQADLQEKPWQAICAGFLAGAFAVRAIFNLLP